MPYRLRPGKHFTGEVRSVAEEELRAAIALLTQQPHGLHEAIHQARRKLKRIRALYRLTAHAEKSFRRGENARLRDIARSLSAARDATALIETLSYLGGHTASGEEARAVETARAVLSARRDAAAEADTGLGERVDEAVRSCTEAVTALDALTFSDRPRKVAGLLAEGWLRTAGRASDALDACHEGADAEAFHELRKASQSYAMNLALLRDIWPSALTAKREHAKALVAILGHEHDISLLVALLNVEPGLLGGGEDLSHLLGTIIRRQQALRREALECAETVYADKPAREAGIVRMLWLHAARG